MHSNIYGTTCSADPASFLLNYSNNNANYIYIYIILHYIYLLSEIKQDVTKHAI